MVQLGSTDDRRGDDRLGKQPRQRTPAPAEGLIGPAGELNAR
jgi:hypothetical protein